MNQHYNSRFFRENEEKRKENKIIDLLMQEFEADEVIFCQIEWVINGNKRAVGSHE
jgi:hypothetical protein